MVHLTVEWGPTIQIITQTIHQWLSAWKGGNAKQKSKKIDRGSAFVLPPLLRNYQWKKPGKIQGNKKDLCVLRISCGISDASLTNTVHTS